MSEELELNNKKDLIDKKYMPQIIAAGAISLGIIGYLTYSIISDRLKPDTTVTPTAVQTNTTPKVIRYDLSSNASKNNTSYNAAEKTGLSEPQTINIVRTNFTNIPSEYEMAFDRVGIKDGKPYNIVKLYYKGHPESPISWFYVDPKTKKTYKLNEANNMLYLVKRLDSTYTNRTITKKVIGSCND